MENLVGQQAGEHQIEYRIGTGGGLFDPELGVAGLRLVGDLRQDRIEQLVAGRRRIDQRQRFEIGIDAVFECQVGQHRTGQDARQIPAMHLLQVAALLVQKKDDQFFGQSHEDQYCPAANTSSMLRNERHKTSLAGGPSVSRPAGHHHRDRPSTLLYHPPAYANVCPAPIDNLEAPRRRTDLLRTAAPQAPRLRPMCARAA